MMILYWYSFQQKLYHFSLTKVNFIIQNVIGLWHCMLVFISIKVMSFLTYKIKFYSFFLSFLLPSFFSSLFLSPSLFIQISHFCLSLSFFLSLSLSFVCLFLSSSLYLSQCLTLSLSLSLSFFLTLYIFYHFQIEYIVVDVKDEMGADSGSLGLCEICGTTHENPGSI